MGKKPATPSAEFDAKTDPLGKYFASQLSTKETDSGPRPVIASGDCLMMLMLLRVKSESPDVRIDETNPGRFRGTKDIAADMKRVLGELPKFHIPKWGASHFRGGLRDDEKRGNKRHIIRFIQHLNKYKGTKAEVAAVYEYCIRLHHQFWDSFSLTVEVQLEDPAQKKLLKLLSLATLGRVQQGLVYSTLRRRYGDKREIRTKKTFAGDEQSSQGGTVQKGDVQVWLGETLEIALEVKDAEINETVWERVKQTHESHDYALFVLGTSFRPADLQSSISGLENTYAVHLADYVMTLLFMTAADENVAPRTVLHEIVEVFNSEFCDQVERDPTLKLTLVETAGEAGRP
jgi:hypothetical protein